MSAQWLNEHECSEHTRIPVGTLRDWRGKRLYIPFVRVGVLIRYNLVDVDAYMESQKVKVAS